MTLSLEKAVQVEGKSVAHSQWQSLSSWPSVCDVEDMGCGVGKRHGMRGIIWGCSCRILGQSFWHPLGYRAVKGLYSFPRAAVTKYQKLGGLKQQKCILSVLKARSLKSGCQQGRLPYEGCGEWLFSLPLLLSSDRWHSLAYGHISHTVINSNLCSIFLHITVYIPLCLCLFCLIQWCLSFDLGPAWLI